MSTHGRPDTIPEAFYDLLIDKMTFAALATHMPDGHIHVTPVWVDYDPNEELVLINTERERQKDVNMRRNPKVGVYVPDPENAWRWVSIQGEVVEMTEEGAKDHIDELARKWFDVDEYPNPVQTARVIVKIRPDRIITRDDD